jgi:hypothetical protein
MKRAKTILDSFAYYANLLTFISVTVAIIFGFTSLDSNTRATGATVKNLSETYTRNHETYRRSAWKVSNDMVLLKNSLYQKERDHDKFERRQAENAENLLSVLNKLHDTLNAINSKIAFKGEKKEIVLGSYKGF